MQPVRKKTEENLASFEVRRKMKIYGIEIDKKRKEATKKRDNSVSLG